MKKTLFILFLISLLSGYLYSQNLVEYYFKFSIDDKSELDTITQIISIDNVKDFEVYAYAMPDELDEFKKLGYKIEFLQKDIPKSITMATTVEEMSNWDRYPTYEVYRQLMKNFESNYPSLCKLDSIGETNNGRQLYVLKISDNVDIEESEPEFFYTSTMHGDEATGFILMLRFADSLLNSYGSASQVTNLINEVEIYINPNANPDGTYYGGNNTVSGAIRSNGVADLNRDYPDPRTGANSPYQPETQAMMDFAEAHHFVMSANFHGGAEVLNYPWDTWYYSENPHADTDWFEHICTDYVTVARTINSGYLKNPYSDGVTHGATWYKVAGGRQDYMTYFHQCREVTMEISSTKLLAVESLNNFWNYNKQSLLNYINECLYGIRGTVNNLEDNPLKAMIEIIGHDEENDSSMVFTDPDKGDYHRLIEAGTYDVVASAEGYINDTIKDVEVNWSDITWVNFTLLKPGELTDSISLSINPDLIEDTLFFDQSNSHNIIIKNDSNTVTTNYSIEINNSSVNQWISLNKNSGNLYGTQNDTVIATVNTNNLVADDYSTYIILTSADSETDTIIVNLFVKDTISINIEPKQVIDTLWADSTKQYEIYIENNGISDFNYNLYLDPETSEWLTIDKKSGNLSEIKIDTITATIETSGIGFGNFNCNIVLEKENSTYDTIEFSLYVKDTILTSIEPKQIVDTLWAGDNSEYEIYIENSGLNNLNYALQIDDQSNSNWLTIDKNNGSLSIGDVDTITASVNTKDYGVGNFSCNLIVGKENSTNDTVEFLLYVKDTISSMVNPTMISDTLLAGDESEYNIYIKNNGLINLNYSLFIDDLDYSEWFSTNKSSGSILSNDTDTIKAHVNSTDYGIGDFNCNLIIEYEDRSNDTIEFQLYIEDTIISNISPLFFKDTLDQNISKDYYLFIENVSNNNLDYSILLYFPDKSDTWINLDKENSIINTNSKDTITLNINTTDLAPDDYSCQLTVNINDEDSYAIPVDIHVNQIQSVTNLLELDNVNIYPNPFNHEIVLSFNYLSNNPVYLSLFSISGNVLYKQEIKSLYNGKNIIIISNDKIINLPKGLYLLKLSTSNYEVIKKVVKD